MTETAELEKRFDDLEALIRTIAVAPGSDTIWSYKDCADYLRVSVSTVQKYAATAPGWPRKHTPQVDADGRCMSPRYRAVEVIAWALRQEEARQ